MGQFYCVRIFGAVALLGRTDGDMREFIAASECLSGSRFAGIDASRFGQSPLNSRASELGGFA